MPYAAASFGDCRTQTLGAVTGTSTGTLVTASATPSAKGNWASLGQASRSYGLFHVGIGASSAAADYVFDIGLSADGSTGWFAIAENLRISGLKGAADLFLSYSIPVRIPEGFFVGIRCASSTASATLRAIVTAATSMPLGAGSFSECKAYYTATTSRGVTIDAGSTANTKPAWTSVGTVGANEMVDAIMIGIGPNADVTRTAATTGLLDIGVGSAGAQYVVLQNILWGFTTTSDTPFPNVIGPLPVSIPQSSTIWARMQSTNTAAGDRTIDLAIWGLIA